MSLSKLTQVLPLPLSLIFLEAKATDVSTAEGMDETALTGAGAGGPRRAGAGAPLFDPDLYRSLDAKQENKYVFSDVVSIYNSL